MTKTLSFLTAAVLGLFLVMFVGVSGYLAASAEKPPSQAQVTQAVVTAEVVQTATADLMHRVERLEATADPALRKVATTEAPTTRRFFLWRWLGL